MQNLDASAVGWRWAAVGWLGVLALAALPGAARAQAPMKAEEIQQQLMRGTRGVFLPGSGDGRGLERADVRPPAGAEAPVAGVPALPVARVEGPPPAAVALPAPAVAPAPPSVSFQIQFDFNSARVRPESFLQLNELSRALQSSALLPSRFLVEGHTDAKGSDEVNRRLSLQRAQAVAAYLAARGVEARRLPAAGMGPTDLANKADPFAAENRRVRIVNLD